MPSIFHGCKIIGGYIKLHVETHAGFTWVPCGPSELGGGAQDSVREGVRSGHTACGKALWEPGGWGPGVHGCSSLWHMALQVPRAVSVVLHVFTGALGGGAAPPTAGRDGARGKPSVTGGGCSGSSEGLRWHPDGTLGLRRCRRCQAGPCAQAGVW